MTTIEFDLVVWNANSINSKMNEISLFLSTHSPSILAIIETHHTSPPTDSFPLYTCLSYPSRIKKSGGTVLFVHDSVRYKEVKERLVVPSTPTTITWLELTLVNVPFNVLFGTVYIHPATTAAQLQRINNHIEKICKLPANVNKPIILAGDFNRYCPQWGQAAAVGGPANAASSTINLMHNLSLTCLNSLSPNILTNRYNVIDLAFTNTPALISSFTVDSNLPLHSDHYPLRLVLESPVHLISPSHKCRYDLTTASWGAYQKRLSTLLPSFHSLFDSLTSQLAEQLPPSIQHFDPTSADYMQRQHVVNELTKSLTDSMILTADMVLTKKKQQRTSTNKNHWWKHEPTLIQARNNCKTAHRTYLNSPTNSLLKANYLSSRSTFRSLCASAKRTAFALYVKDIEEAETPKQLWQHYKRINPKPTRPLSNISTHAQNAQPQNHSESLNNLASHFAQISGHTVLDINNNNDNNMRSFVHSSPNNASSCPPLSPSHDDAFTLQEVCKVLSSCPPATALGPDLIHPEFLNQGGPELHACFHRLFTLSWK